MVERMTKEQRVRAIRAAACSFANDYGPLGAANAGDDETAHKVAGCLISALRRNDLMIVQRDKEAADRIEQLEAENARMREALEWYAEHGAGCRKIHSGGDASRHALQEDGGKRAQAALSPARGG